MNLMDSDGLVNDYLEALARAAQSLPAQRREELLADVRSHVAESGATTEVEVRNVLERLGSPEEILAAYEEAPPTRPEPRLRLREYAALVLLPFGGFLFVVGWLVGVVLLWTSDRWRTGEKLLGTLSLPLGYLSLVILALLPGRSCAGISDATGTVVESCSGVGLPGWVGVPLLVLLAVAPLVSIAVLAKRAAPDRA